MEDFSGETLLFPEKPEQKMLGANVLVIQPLRFFSSVSENPFALMA